METVFYPLGKIGTKHFIFILAKYPQIQSIFYNLTQTHKLVEPPPLVSPVYKITSPPSSCPFFNTRPGPRTPGAQFLVSQSNSYPLLLSMYSLFISSVKLSMKALLVLMYILSALPGRP